MLAQEEARRLGHNFVGTEQLLLGLIGESTGEQKRGQSHRRRLQQRLGIWEARSESSPDWEGSAARAGWRRGAETLRPGRQDPIEKAPIARKHQTSARVDAAIPKTMLRMEHVVTGSCGRLREKLLPHTHACRDFRDATPAHASRASLTAFTATKFNARSFGIAVGCSTLGWVTDAMDIIRQHED